MLIYQSPNAEKRRSAPIAETDLPRRRVLENKGWTIVERIGDAPAAASAPAPDPTGNEATATWLGGLDFLKDEQRAELEKAGLISADAVRAATDDDLRAIKGVGPAAVRDLRKATVPPAT